ncbi:uncharacterized protein LOC114714660 [Neltuma alba]|uniref:uncharacterized protein LOC114714660 n=1 Tax=Neltuma alba TaxID=207710 RepID=UPI0010A50FCA|nr:uncharacterized protein LOC114714660 [Prosopis alba]
MDVSSLLLERNQSGLTCLQLLARMPTAFRSHYPLGSLANLIYNSLPDEIYEIEVYDSFELLRPSSDLETGQQNDAKPPASVFVGIDFLWRRKKHHQLAERLAKFLVKHDYSWQISYNHIKKTLVVLLSVVYNVAKRKKQVERKEEKRQDKQDLDDDDDDQDPNKQAEKKHHYGNHTPLLVAASNGIIEIVQLFLEEHPESVNHVSEDEQNILHMAVKHRQLEIFKLLKKNPSFGTLVNRISRENHTVLHQVARMDYYRVASLAGAAFQLQAELKWYKTHKHGSSKMPSPAPPVGARGHGCFAAAYTIPGGSEGGTPVYLRSSVFIFFTVMDIVALAFSLASVVMSLSILTSPFELWDFKRLQWKQWTSTLVYSAAFFPVTIFGLIEFPLYMMPPSLICKVHKKIMKILYMVCKAIERSMASSSSLPIISSSDSVVAFSHSIFVKLDDSNFLIWRQQVLSAVKGYALELFLDSSIAPPEQFELHDD